jgi:hypothetical protein
MPPSEHEETPVPGTAAEDGRRKLGAYEGDNRPAPPAMQAEFYTHIARALSAERLDAYAGDQASPTVTLARYLLNLALCESLYSPLQLCEVALRNSLHQHLAGLVGSEFWFDTPAFSLTPWAVEEVRKAKAKIAREHRPVTAGRIVAELQFGFWTSLFEAHYEQNPTRFLPTGIRAVFPRLPKSRHHRKELKRTLEEIRALRNRVFHHERIVHWQDLDTKHAAILEVIGWVSPELHEMAFALDRFSAIRQAGLAPWLAKLCTHWPPTPPPQPAAPPASPHPEPLPAPPPS